MVLACFVLKDFGYIHAKPLLFVPFTEYPSSPSLYICRWWAGRRRRLECVFESLFWTHDYAGFVLYSRRQCYFFYVGESWKSCFLACIHCILYMTAREAFWSRCNRYFALLYSSCKDVCHIIGLMHSSYGLLVFWFIASAFVSPYVHTLIVLNFWKLAFGNYGLLAITAPNY